MAYYLAVDNGASGESVSFNSTINTTTGNSFSVEWRSNYTSSGNATYAVTGSSVSNGIAITATEVRFYAFQGGTYTLAHNIADYTQLKTFRVDYDGTDLKLYVDNSLETTESNVGSSFFTASAISETGSRGSFDLYFLKISESGTLIHHFDPSAANGTGTTLEDTVGSNDGTLLSFDGTTNSWWVSYTPSGSISVTIVETAPSFTDSITANVTSIGLITASIAESGPSFTDYITATSTSSTSGVNNWGAVNTWSSSLGISLSISESGPSFTDSIAVSVVSVGLITASILEYGPAFSDSVVTVVTSNIVTSIVGAGPSFTDAVSITVTTPQQINISIVESGPSFIESILMSTPTAWVDKVPKTTAWTDRAISSTIWQDK
jgi:hypothetical protein